MRRQISAEQRAAILRAGRDARAHGPVALVSQNGRMVMSYDAVNLASDTGNYWWSGLDNATCEAGLRLVHMGLRRGCQS
jgi:hypothetical protein